MKHKDRLQLLKLYFCVKT